MCVLDKLIRKIRRGEIILWAGSGLSLYAGLPSSGQLVDIIINNARKDERAILNKIEKSLPNISQEFFEMRNSKRKLIDIIRKEIEIEPKDITLHKLISEIPQFKCIITTNYDKLFEQLYGNSVRVVIQNAQIPYSNNNREVELYKIHGDLSFKDSIILTNDDYTNLYRNLDNPIWNKIKSIIAGHSILFIGYSLKDPHIQFIFDNILKSIKPYNNECFLITPNLQPYKQKSFLKRKINCINMKAEESIPQIHKEIIKHLLVDCRAGFVDLKKGAKILHGKGFEINFETTKDGINLNEFKLLNKNDCLDLNLNFNTQTGSDFIDFMSGKKFGEFTLKKGSINNFGLYYKDIIIPIIDDAKEMELIIKSKPVKSYYTELILKNSGLSLDNVLYEVYSSQSLLQINIKNELIKINLLINKLEKGKNIFKFKINDMGSVSQCKLLFNFLYTWINGDEIIIFDDTGQIIPINISPKKDGIEKFRNMLDFTINFYSDLDEIQRFFKVHFNLKNVEFRGIDLKIIDQVKNSIKNNKTCIEDATIEYKFIPEGLIKFREILEPETFGYKYVSNDFKNVKLFNVDLCLGRECIESIDAYIENRDEVEQLLEKECTNIPIKIKSKTDELYLSYIKE